MPMEKVGCEVLHRLDKEEARALGAVLGLAPVSEDRFWLLPSRLHLARILRPSNQVGTSGFRFTSPPGCFWDEPLRKCDHGGDTR